MELPVLLQLRELLWAVAVGAGLGLLYDLLGPLRRGPQTRFFVTFQPRPLQKRVLFFEKLTFFCTMQ